MKAKQLTLISTIAIGIAGCIGIVSILGAVNGTNVSALTYQSTINSEFTINPAINVSLSSADLIINDLEPGTTKDSNIITVTVSTNNSSGYTLGSTVGNSTTYDYDALKNNVDNTKSFTNLTSTGSLTAGKWGYSYSNDNGTTWYGGNDSSSNPIVGYGGLPLYTSTPVEIASSSSASTTSTQFKIGAYATTGQAAGEYNNVVNFIATASPKPHYYMQDFTSATIAALLPNINDSAVAYDKRDEQAYTIAKLADNKYWMTTNLNLAGGTQLSADDTDMDSTWTLPTANGFGTNNTLPASQVIVSGSTLDGGFTDDTQAYVFNSNNNECVGENPCFSYYSWTAATLGSGLDILTDNTDAPYSICPKGWKLPNDKTGTDSSSDFRALIIALGGSNTIQTYNDSTIPTGAEIFTKITSYPYNFILSGGCNMSEYTYNSGHGSYYSSTSRANLWAYRLRFNSTEFQNTGSSQRRAGSAIRCIRSS